MENITLKQQIKGYIDLIRPFTLLAPIIVSSCIMIASLFYNQAANDIFIICFTTIILSNENVEVCCSKFGLFN